MFFVQKWNFVYLSIHDLTRRSTYHFRIFCHLVTFQFTTSQGGRHNFSPSCCDVATFQFTTSQGGRLLAIASPLLQHNTFNSRPHKEVDHSSPRRSLDPSPFNSRPHKEVDCAVSYISLLIDLSIHDLTRRSTFLVSTIFDRIISFNSRPHKEVDHLPLYNRRHSGTFQFTTSQGGRPRSVLVGVTLQTPFNSRPHKEVDNHQALCQLCFSVFQFTTSQGGRRATGDEFEDLRQLSIHDLTRRSTGFLNC